MKLSVLGEAWNLAAARDVSVLQNISTGGVAHPASSLLCSLRPTIYHHPVQRLRMSGAKGAQSFQKFRRHLKILDARRMTWRAFHTEYPQIVGATVHNLVSLPIWCPGLMHPWVKPYLRSLLVYHKDRCVFVIKETRKEHVSLVVWLDPKWNSHIWILILIFICDLLNIHCDKRVCRILCVVKVDLIDIVVLTMCVNLAAVWIGLYRAAWHTHHPYYIQSSGSIFVIHTFHLCSEGVFWIPK